MGHFWLAIVLTGLGTGGKRRRPDLAVAIGTTGRKSEGQEQQLLITEINGIG